METGEIKEWSTADNLSSYPFDGPGYTLAHAYFPYEFGKKPLDKNKNINCVSQVTLGATSTLTRMKTGRQT